jgi:hypothetical protein
MLFCRIDEEIIESVGRQSRAGIKGKQELDRSRTAVSVRPHTQQLVAFCLTDGFSSSCRSFSLESRLFVKKLTSQSAWFKKSAATFKIWTLPSGT